MFRWVFSILSAALLAAAVGATPAQADHKIKQIKERGALRVCHAEALPMNYKDPKTDKWTGYNVDASENLAEVMEVDLENIDATWATVIPSLLADKCDVALIGLFRTAARAQVILFADAWGFDTQSVAVAEGSAFQTYADLDQPGKIITVLSGTADEAFAKRFFKKATVKSLVSDKVSTIFLEVASKRADGTLTDSTTLRLFLKENPAMKLKRLPADDLNPQGYSYAVAPGEYQLQQFLNVWMERTETDGTKQRWHKKWFEQN